MLRKLFICLIMLSMVMVFACDDPVDTDGDGIIDDDDNCVEIANANQADADGDAVGDVCDNCIAVSNANQADSDGDKIGNACDNCPSVSNANQADTDVDGVGNVCDNCPDISNADQADTDGDGIGDVCDGASAEELYCDVFIPSLNDIVDKIWAAGYQPPWTIYGDLSGEAEGARTVDAGDPSDPFDDTGTTYWTFHDYNDTGVIINGEIAVAPINYCVLMQNCITYANGQLDITGDISATVVLSDIVAFRKLQRYPELDTGYVTVSGPGISDTTIFMNGPDLDEDCLGEYEDNCPNVYNPDQADSDGDGIGDACES